MLRPRAGLSPCLALFSSTPSKITKATAIIMALVAVVEAVAAVVAVPAVAARKLRVMFIEVLLTTTAVAAAMVMRCGLLYLTWSEAVA